MVFIYLGLRNGSQLFFKKSTSLHKGIYVTPGGPVHEGISSNYQTLHQNPPPLHQNHYFILLLVMFCYSVVTSNAIHKYTICQRSKVTHFI